MKYYQKNYDHSMWWIRGFKWGVRKQLEYSINFIYLKLSLYRDLRKTFNDRGEHPKDLFLND